MSTKTKSPYARPACSAQTTPVTDQRRAASPTLATDQAPSVLNDTHTSIPTCSSALMPV